MDWARGFCEAMAEYATGGTYVNRLDGDEDDCQRAAYAAKRMPIATRRKPIDKRDVD